MLMSQFKQLNKTRPHQNRAYKRLLLAIYCTSTWLAEGSVTLSSNGLGMGLGTGLGTGLGPGVVGLGWASSMALSSNSSGPLASLTLQTQQRGGVGHQWAVPSVLLQYPQVWPQAPIHMSPVLSVEEQCCLLNGEECCRHRWEKWHSANMIWCVIWFASSLFCNVDHIYVRNRCLCSCLNQMLLQV